VNVLERLVGEHRAVTSGLASPSPWLIDAVTTGETYSGQRVSAEKALSLTPFRSAVTLIAETIGLLPFKVYRDLGDGAKVSARDHRAWRMLHDKPNPVTTAHRFWSTVATHLLVWGNAYIEKLRDESGLVTELWLRDPTQMAVEWNDVSKRRRFFEDGPSGRKFWTDEQILHIPGWSVNGLTGESMVYRGRQTIGNAIAREEFEGSFYRRGAVLSLVIKHPGTLKPGSGRPAQRHVLGALRRLEERARDAGARGRRDAGEGVADLAGAAVRGSAAAVTHGDRGDVPAAARVPRRHDRRLADVRDGGVEHDPVRAAHDPAVHDDDRVGGRGRHRHFPVPVVVPGVRAGRAAAGPTRTLARSSTGR
jgi:phage portal protein BeeE